ncbi:MAG: radical SAM protein [Desulfobacterales bacterium]|nr:radical SAM protein [Desulfobacterales bacterium]
MLFLSNPIHYNLELTPQCNNNCPGCGNVLPDRSVAPLPAARWKDILKKLAPHAAIFRISGGEPELHPEFETIVKFIGSLGISFTVFTNACWKDSQRTVELLRNIEQCKGLLVSLHGSVPEMHESFSNVKGSFLQTTGNIRQAACAGINIATSTVVTKANYNHIHDIISLSASLGAKRAIFARYLPVKSSLPAPDNNQLQKAVEAVDKHHENRTHTSFSVCIPQCFKSSSSVGCLSGITYCVVDPWGNVRPCTHVPLVCGNLLKQSVKEIWHGLEMQRWREKIPVQCHTCHKFSKCRGGCRAAAMLHNLDKDPLAGEPVPENARSINEDLELYEGLYPVGHFTMHRESFGYVLIRGNLVTPVSHKAKPILDALNGYSALHRIESYFGKDALNFVGALYQKGFVELRERKSKNIFTNTEAANSDE